MDIFVQGNAEELKRGKHWWRTMEMQWNMAFNEAVFGKGPTLEPPKDEELIIILVRADSLRFAGPLAINPNLSMALTNLSGLAGLPHLTYLSFSDAAITSLKEISHLVKLQHLFVYNNKLTSLEGVENMLELQNLYAQHNEIKDILPIQRLTKLETLYICDNHLTSLAGLTEAHEENMKNLYVMPNEQLRQREIIRVQNEIGVICKRG